MLQAAVTLGWQHIAFESPVQYACRLRLNRLASHCKYLLQQKHVTRHSLLSSMSLIPDNLLVTWNTVDILGVLVHCLDRLPAAILEGALA